MRSPACDMQQAGVQGSNDPSKLAALQDEISKPFQGVYKNGKLEKMRFVPGNSNIAAADEATQPTVR